MSIYDIEVTTLAGDSTTLADHQGKVMLIVNTASKCGFTPQYEGLEKLHQQFDSQGLTVLGFPCNQFGGQEPAGHDEIASFCQINYGVSFQMHSKIKVNGKDTHPLFQHLKTERPGLLGSKGIKWNFTKFLVGRDGAVVKRFGPKVEPADMAEDIKALL
jgi:glutathione peroxidase